MKRYSISFVAVALLVGLGLTIGCQRAVEPVIDLGPPPPDVPPEDLAALVEGNNQFALDLYKKLAETEKGNIFFSPYSISSALAMTYAGARGQTAEEMAKVLGIAKLGDKVHPAHASLAYKLKSAGGKDKPEFHIANSLWGQTGLPFKPEFLQLTRKHYGAGLQEVNFGDTENARGTINKWVGEQTREKIPELLKPGVLTGNTKLVLTNAIYFKGAWATPFLKSETKQAQFEISPSEKITVVMMQTQDAPFKYHAAADCEWLELPYIDNRMSMILMLPQKGFKGQSENLLTTSVIQNGIDKLKSRRGKVAIPLFEINMISPLNDRLIRMGMRHAFTNEADFSGMAGNSELQIGSVTQQAYLKVDEFGSEASAATAIQIATSENLPFSFTANRPFLFFIRDNLTKSILFIGYVVQPGKIF